MKFIDVLGLVAGICTSASLFPQIITTLKKKKAGEVSFTMFIVMLSGNALWIYYGINKSEFAIISTNFLSLFLNIIMLILKFRYKEN